jgi:hypothetical protein
MVASSGKIKDDLHRTMRLSAELGVLASAPIDTIFSPRPFGLQQTDTDGAAVVYP